MKESIQGVAYDTLAIIPEKIDLRYGYVYLIVIAIVLLVSVGIYYFLSSEDDSENGQKDFDITKINKTEIRQKIESYFENFMEDQAKWYRIMVLSVKYSFDAEQESYDKKIESVSGFKDINEDWAPEEIQAAQEIFVEIIKENTGVDTRGYSENKMIRFYRRYMELKAKKNALESIENKIDVDKKNRYANNLEDIEDKIGNHINNF